ncbi:MAG: hypothetical protein ACKOAH_21290, partial [Pirellula sp.]
MSSKKDPQENQTQIRLGEDPTIFENSNAQPSETLQNPSDLLEVPASLLGELTSDQTVDYSPANSTDPPDPNCQTIGATPSSENDDNQDPNAATCDFIPQNDSNPDGTAVLPKGWASKKSSQD